MSAVAFLLTFFAAEKSQSQRSEKNGISSELIILPPEFQCDPSFPFEDVKDLSKFLRFERQSIETEKPIRNKTNRLPK